MERILNQSHNKETFFYGLSRVLERASYYGLRAIIILYMVGESLKMDRSEALNIYALFTASLFFSQVIGAILGDLVIGNRKSIILGGIIQAIGALCCCIASITGLYIGLFLVILGGGLYTPNIISNFGKLYLNKTKLLDSAFTFFYLAINLGAFLGILLIGFAGEKYGWNIGFIIAGTLMLLSIIPVLILKEKDYTENLSTGLSINERVIKILIAFVVVGLFWAIYPMSDMRVFDLQPLLSEFSRFNIPKTAASLNSVLILPIGLLAIIFWTYFYSSQFFKLAIGFIFGVISFGVLFLIPEIPTEQQAILFLLSLFFLNVSEIHIAPIIHSVLTEFTNPKYLAIMVSLSFIPIKLFSLIVGLFNESLYESPSFAILIGMIAMAIVSVGLIIYNLINKKTTHNK